jgi:hypothetical protein
MFRFHFFHQKISSSSPSLLLISSSKLFQQANFNSSNSNAAVPSTEQLQLARVVAASRKLTAYMNLHRSNVNVSKKRIALQAWREIDDLPQKYLEIADIDSVVRMLNVLSYFSESRDWENGYHGPSNPLPNREEKKRDKSLPARDAEEIDIPAEFFHSLSGGVGGANNNNINVSGISNQQNDNSQTKGRTYINPRRVLERPAVKKPVNTNSSADIIGDMIE